MILVLSKDFTNLNLNEIIFRRIKTLAEKQAIVTFEEILQVSNRKKEDVKIILDELIKAGKIQETKQGYFEIIGE